MALSARRYMRRGRSSRTTRPARTSARPVQSMRVRPVRTQTSAWARRGVNRTARVSRRSFFRGRDAPQEEKIDENKLDPYQREGLQALKAGRHADAIGFHKDAGMLGDSGLWKEYGFATTAGFATIAAVSKEFIILNEETMILGVFGAFCFSVYVTMGHKVLEYFENEQKSNLEFWRGYYDAQRKVYQQWRDDISGLSRDPDHWQELNQYQLDVAHKYYETLNRVAKLEGVQITQNALRLTEQKEALEAQKFSDNLIDTTMTNVHKRFRSLSAQQKNDIFEESLALAEAVAKGQAVPESKAMSPEDLCTEVHMEVIGDLWKQHGSEVKVSPERQNQLFDEKRATLSRVFPKPLTWEQSIAETGWDAADEALFVEEKKLEDFRMQKWNEVQTMVRKEDCASEVSEIPQAYLEKLATARGMTPDEFWGKVTDYNKGRN